MERPRTYPVGGDMGMWRESKATKEPGRGAEGRKGQRKNDEVRRGLKNRCYKIMEAIIVVIIMTKILLVTKLQIKII